MQDRELKDYAHLHFLVVVWGFTAILGLLISIPAVEIVFFRTALSIAGLWILLLATRKKILIGFSPALKMFLTGFLIGGHWILFFASARVANASICLAGLATTSFWTSLIEPAIMKRKVLWYEIFLGVLVISGLYVVFHFEFDHALGLAMAVLSAVAAALFTVINGRLIVKNHHYTITFYEMAGAFVATILFLPFYTAFFSDGIVNLTPSATDWIYLAILAWVCTVYAYSASVELMKRLSAFAISITVNLEPVYGIVLAVLFFGEKEKMNLEFYVGTLVILSAALSYPMIRKRHRKRALKMEALRS